MAIEEAKKEATKKAINDLTPETPQQFVQTKQLKHLPRSKRTTPTPKSSESEYDSESSSEYESEERDVV